MATGKHLQCTSGCFLWVLGDICESNMPVGSTADFMRKEWKKRKENISGGEGDYNSERDVVFWGESLSSSSHTKEYKATALLLLKKKKKMREKRRRMEVEYSYFSGERKWSSSFSAGRTCSQNKFMVTIMVAITLSHKQQSNSNTSF